MNPTRTYAFDETLSVWTTAGHQGTSYSDGDAFEEWLLQALKQTRDISTGSAELAALIKDWPSEYHLSPARYNLLRPFRFDPSVTVLELGCGCGAMTRYLGETGARVIAIEGSRRRAAIAAERCRDLPNVSVYCDNLQSFQTEEQFDVVTLIGVLEYAPIFIKDQEPVQACLAKAGHFLHADGRLLLAIENQLGLKYFNGCAEDHVGIPYFGTQDLYNSKTPITFGKQDLSRRLHAAGFPSTQFYFPFPDYKLPNIIIAEQAIDRPSFALADLLCRVISRNHGSPGPYGFHEYLAWRPVVQNRLIGDLSNSFLVVARRSAPAAEPTDWLARTYSGSRRREFAVETAFLIEGNSIGVKKRLLYSDRGCSADTRAFTLHHLPASSAPYIDGRLYVTKLQSILARGAGLSEVTQWAAPWVQLLLTQSLFSGYGDRLLPGSLVDAIPTNLVETSTGVLEEIDKEWVIDGSIPLLWVLIRGLVTAIASSPAPPELRELSFKSAIQQILQSLGVSSSASDFDEAAALEDALNAAVYDSSTAGCGYANVLTRKISESSPGLTYLERIDALNAEIDRVKSTVSWRITKPLRAVWNLTGKPLRAFRWGRGLQES